MTTREPIAFLSYVRFDDQHERGRISELCRRLEGEVRMQTGRNFAIFQDRNDIAWGQNWSSRIESALADVSFLIPIVTSSYFRSPMCRKEFEIFRKREETLGEDRLILPIYYLDADEIENHTQDDIAALLRSRNWSDWRQNRFKSFEDPLIEEALAVMAKRIKQALSEISAVMKAAEHVLPATSKLDGKVVEREKIGENPPRTIRPDKISSRLPAESPTTKPTAKTVRGFRYKVFTHEFDEIIRPADITESEEIIRLFKRLNKEVSEARSRIGTTAVARRKLNQYAKGKRIFITFLVDNSGSLKGPPIKSIASSMILLLEVLEGTDIQTEVLGFTTRAWKGGQSREKWLSEGKPQRPGRLNDIRHIIYKKFDESFAEASLNLGLMVREGLLKENIDGEALLWAQSRLAENSAKNRVLVVISDGAPVDDSTLQVNPPNTLEMHLRQVVAKIEAQKSTQLYAVGLGHDISRYYTKSVNSAPSILYNTLVTLITEIVQKSVA